MKDIIYPRSCLVCNKDISKKRKSSKTCGQICRNALSNGRKIARIVYDKVTDKKAVSVLAALVNSKDGMKDGRSSSVKSELTHDEAFKIYPHDKIILAIRLRMELSRMNNGKARTKSMLEIVKVL